MPSRRPDSSGTAFPTGCVKRLWTWRLSHPEESSRQLAWRYTDEEGSFVSESSVYRILKGYDLITSPVFQLVTAKDRF